jgi:hypothetical protein
VVMNSARLGHWRNILSALAEHLSILTQSHVELVDP